LFYYIKIKVTAKKAINGICLQAGLAIFAFCRIAAKTKITLRLSKPDAGRAGGLL